MGVCAVSRQGALADARAHVSRKISDLKRNFAAAGLSGNIAEPGGRDGMLGALLLESILGPAFLAAANDLLPPALQEGGAFSGTGVDLKTITDIACEIREESAADECRYKKGAGKGTEARLFGPQPSRRPLPARGGETEGDGAPLSSLRQSLAKALREREDLDSAVRNTAFAWPDCSIL